MTQQLRILGVNIADVTLVQAVDEIMRCAADRSRATRFAFVNADCLNLAVTNTAYRKVLNTTAAVFGDGSGVRYASRFYGREIIDNVNGTDLFPLLCEKAVDNEKSIFFLGGKPGVAEAAVDRQAVHTDCCIANTLHDRPG